MEPNAAETAEEQAAIRSALMHLVRLATLLRLRRVGAEDPEVRAQQFADRMEEALLQGPPVMREITADGMWSEGAKMMGEDLLAAHVCQTLSAEGLRAIFIEPTVTTGELRRLAWLLASDWTVRALFEPDLQASAWQSRFAAVHLDVVGRRLEVDDDDDDDELVSQLLQQLAAPDLANKGSLGALLSHLRTLSSEPRRRRNSDESRLALEHPQAFEQLCRRLEQVRENTDVDEDRVSLVVFETLRNESESEAVNAIADGLCWHVRRALAEGLPATASTLLHWPLMLLDEALFPAWPHRAALKGALRGLVAPDVWQAIREGFGRCQEPEVWKGPLLTITLAMSIADLDTILSAASTLPSRTLREAVADGAILLMRRAGMPDAALLDTTRSAGLKVALLAMTRSADATQVGRILSHFTSTDADIREAVLVALRRQQSPRIKAAARAGLLDPAEVVRLEALRYLAVYRDIEGAERIEARLRAIQPGEASPAELRALARALVLIRGEGAIEILKTLALQPRLTGFPDLADAVLRGLHAAGSGGDRALDEIGLLRADLRPQIRTLLRSPQ